LRPNLRGEPRLSPLTIAEPDVDGIVRELSGAAASDAAMRRQEVTRRVVQASFDVDSAIADIQQEQAALGPVTNALQSNRDARLTVLNIAAGVLAVGAAERPDYGVAPGVVEPVEHLDEITRRRRRARSAATSASMAAARTRKSRRLRPPSACRSG
jgi:hypothetical protein